MEIRIGNHRSNELQPALQQVRHHFGFTIDPRPGDKCLHHPIFDRVNNCFMRVPRPVYLNVKKFYQDETTYIFDRINQVPMKVTPHYSAYRSVCRA